MRRLKNLCKNLSLQVVRILHHLLKRIRVKNHLLRRSLSRTSLWVRSVKERSHPHLLHLHLKVVLKEQKRVRSLNQRNPRVRKVQLDFQRFSSRLSTDSQMAHFQEWIPMPLMFFQKPSETTPLRLKRDSELEVTILVSHQMKSLLPHEENPLEKRKQR